MKGRVHSRSIQRGFSGFWMHPTVQIFSHQFLCYDIMTLSGMVTAFLFLYAALTRLGIPQRQIGGYILLGIGVQYFGGMIIPFFYRWIYRHQMPWWNVWEKSPGRYFHSVFLSMVFFTIGFSRIFRWPAKKVLDRLIIAAMIASAFGRIGCFLQGCCAGKPASFFCALKFPRNPDVSVHPVQLYMFILEVVMTAALLRLCKKPHRDGDVFWKGVLLYSLYRFLIEFLRTNPEFILGLTHAQVFSIGTFVLSAGILARPFYAKSLDAGENREK